jgi:hypothetical protein
MSGFIPTKQCCRCKDNGTVEKQAGGFHNPAIGAFQGNFKQLGNKDIVIENESKKKALPTPVNQEFITGPDGLHWWRSMIVAKSKAGRLSRHPA